MTRKKKEKEEMAEKSIGNDEAESPKEGKTESKEEQLIETEKKEEMQDVKLLEGEEQKVLEYYDLDDLISKYNILKESNKKDKELLTKHQKESESWKNKHMRLQAEFENAQKRWNKNRQNLRKEYIGYTVKSFLPLYDSFKKALDGDDENKAILKQFYDQFINILKFYKAEQIEVKVNDLFDYNYHEALSSLERDDLPNNSIIEIIQDGWKIDNAILRYAKVIISKEPKPPEPEPVEEEQQEQIEEIKGEIPKEEISVEVEKDDKESQNKDTEPENEYVS